MRCNNDIPNDKRMEQSHLQISHNLVTNVLTHTTTNLVRYVLTSVLSIFLSSTLHHNLAKEH